MADNPSEKKISEASGVKAVLDEAAERIEATWREKLLRETADPQTENALLMARWNDSAVSSPRRRIGMKRLRPTAMSGSPL